MRLLAAWLGACATLGILAAGGDARAQLACRTDKDCEGDLVCTGGTCAKLGAPAPAPPPAAAAPRMSVAPGPKQGSTEGESCTTRSDCKEGLSCVDFKCALSSAARGEPDGPPGVRIGAVYTPIFALGSKFYPPTNQNIGVELMVGEGYLRYHLTVAFLTGSFRSNAMFGLRLEPATIGVAIPLVRQDRMRIEVEPTAALLSWNFLGTDRVDPIFGFATGFDARVNLALGKFFVSASPVGLDFNYLALDEDGAHGTSEISFLTYRTRIFIGVEL